MSPLKLTKADARRALVRHHFAPCDSQEAVFDRLRSIQFDPIAPVGCNHDLVLQSRLKDYRVGEWQKLAYEKRHVYDGWDKMASLVPFEGWPLRRLFSAESRQMYEKKVFQDLRAEVEIVLREISERGAMRPKDFEFQQRRDDWVGSWIGPSVTKQILHALWRSGDVMTATRKNGQHVYDLTERIVPQRLREVAPLAVADAQRELVLERHRAMGIVRPTAPPEVWSYGVLHPIKKDRIAELVHGGSLVPIDVEGMKAHATPQFLTLLDQPSLEPRVKFVAPLDPFIWDRKAVAHVFDFEYIWEIYTPEPKRRWGYYVLPVLFGDRLVARIEFWCRDGVLEVREWHTEPADLGAGFWEAMEPALRQFMGYCSASRVVVRDHVEPKARAFFASLGNS